ncbi:hypothetical protein [Lentibacillus sediminis]|uniref:hypothetical protein n=1 Tax=Lentibacillus sediminis TaxID=1940529 RepID=UPI000C1BF05D|nr:hypothetical protein [Lentibacillus sediminis]
MHAIKMTVLLALLSLLVGCGADTTKDNQQQNTKFTKISTSNEISQKPSNRAKEILHQDEKITAVHAVNTSKAMLIAIEIKHHKRFRLAQIRKEKTKEMKNEFPDMKVELSTDRKIILELRALEDNLQKGSVSKKKLEKELKAIIELSKEQT